MKTGRGSYGVMCAGALVLALGGIGLVGVTVEEGEAQAQGRSGHTRPGRDDGSQSRGQGRHDSKKRAPREGETMGVGRFSPGLATVRAPAGRSSSAGKPSPEEQAKARSELEKLAQAIDAKVAGDVSVSIQKGTCVLERRRSQAGVEESVDLLEVARVNLDSKADLIRLICEPGKKCVRVASASKRQRGMKYQGEMSWAPKSSNDLRQVHRHMRSLLGACHDYHGKER